MGCTRDEAYTFAFRTSMARLYIDSIKNTNASRMESYFIDLFIYPNLMEIMTVQDYKLGGCMYVPSYLKDYCTHLTSHMHRYDSIPILDRARWRATP